MRLTQGTFSYLPDFSDEEIKEQIQYCLNNGWAVSIEHTRDPHPRNVYWALWGAQPMFDVHDPEVVMREIQACRAAFPNEYVRVSAYDSRLGRQVTTLQFIVQRPNPEPELDLERLGWHDRSQRYAIRVHRAGGDLT